MSRTAIDMLGQHIGKWTVISKSNKQTKNRNVYWLCECECGTLQEISGSDLRRGKTLQCRKCAGTSPKDKDKLPIKHRENEIRK